MAQKREPFLDIILSRNVIAKIFRNGNWIWSDPLDPHGGQQLLNCG